MKKLLCAGLLLLTAVFAFAEVDLSGEFMFGMTDIGNSSSVTPKAELNFKAAVDENTTVSVELDSEGDDWSEKNIALDDFRVSSNLTGALGIDSVDLIVTAGLFDVYHCNWNYVSRSGEEYYGSDEAGAYLWNAGPTTNLSANIALGFSGYTLQYWQDFAGEKMSAAFSGTPVEGLNFLLGYASTFSAVTEGNVWVEGGYSFTAGSAELIIPASFTYDLGESTYGWSSGVAADVDAYHVGVGVGGSSTKAAFADCLIEVSTSVVENADMYVIGDLDFSADSAFQSIDLGGKYNFGAFGLGAGYVVASGDDVETRLWGDSTKTKGSGAYIYADLDF